MKNKKIIMRQNHYKTFISILLLFICLNAFGLETEGYYKGMHWRITNPYSKQGLIVDGKQVIPDQFLTLYKYEIGDEIYFQGTGYEKDSYGNYPEEIYNIKGEKIIPYKFCWKETLQVGNGYFFIIRRYSLDQYLVKYTFNHLKINELH